MDQDYSRKEKKKKKGTLKNSTKKQVKLNKAKKSSTSDELLNKPQPGSFDSIRSSGGEAKAHTEGPLSPRGILKRERSTSNPEFIRANVELALHIPNSQKLIANAFMGVSRKRLSSLLEKYQIKKSPKELTLSSGEIPFPPPEKELKSKSASLENKQKSKKKVIYNKQIFSPVILHAFWCVKPQTLAPAGFLIKEILPLENFHLPRKWMVFIILKEARCSKDNSPIAPWLHAAVSKNNGITHTTQPVLSLEPVWNQTFYFKVDDIKKDTINIAVYFTRIRGKDTKEGGCVGKADIEVKTLQVAYGYKAPWDRWEPLHDPNTKSDSKPESFIRIIVQLVPEDVEAFGSIDTQTIRILPETANYKEQYGALISKNKLRQKQTH